jgi:hypothetical protein
MPVASSREVGKKNLDLTESDQVYTRRECEARLGWLDLKKQEGKRNQELIKKTTRRRIENKVSISRT